MQTSDHGGVGIVVAAHAPLASALVETALRIVEPSGDARAGLTVVEMAPELSATDAFGKVEQAIASVDAGRGVLVIADLFGGSAANIALAQLGEDTVEVVTGANLAMLIDALSHRTDTSLSALARRVSDAATGSVVVASALLSHGTSERPAA